MNKGDLIEKGTDSITKLTNAAQSKTLGFCLVICLIIIFWQKYDNAKLTDRLINTNEVLNEKRVQEIRSIVVSEVGQQVQPIAKKVDTISELADSTFKNINSKLR